MCGSSLGEASQPGRSAHGAAGSGARGQLGSTPQAMVSFPNAIRLGFQHYFDFRSRSTRAEYWWWALGTGLADLILTTFNAC